MTIQAADISIVLSGGANNLDPNVSLGGPPSATHVHSGNLNNLYLDITPDEAAAGQTDFRCIYLFNDGDSPAYNVRLWILSEIPGGSSVMVGIQQQDEIQRIAIAGTVTGGNMVLSFQGRPFTSAYQSNLDAWGMTLQNSLRSLTDDNAMPLLPDVIVRAHTTGSLYFDVVFRGQSGSKNQELISVIANNFTPSQEVIISTLIEGGPINTIAPSIDVDTTPPGNVNFYVPTEQSPILLPSIAPSEGFPLWIERITATNTQAVPADGFILRCQIESLNPEAI